ncbi:MAG: hypothetical protein H0T84_06650 [Tatlockia sp.]|nr:hypothetical protein [Tatlockia sp.]
MTKGNLDKILHFKTRFIQILRYLGSKNAELAASEIEKLPDFASDGFHDAYLTSKLLSIALTYMTEKEFKRFEKNSIKSILLATLFGYSRIEEQVDESIGNVFAYCKENPEESLEESLEKFIQDAQPFVSFSNEIQELKLSCDLFITFYETYKTEIDLSGANFRDTFLIKNLHKGPEEDEEDEVVFLSDPSDKAFIEDNGTVIINRLRPCLYSIS